MPLHDVGRGQSGEPSGPLKIVSLEGTLDGRRLRIARLDGALSPADGGDAARAEDLVATAIEEARATGHTLALALSAQSGQTMALDGFKALPCSEAACRTVLPVPWPKEPAWLRAGDDPLRCVPGLRPARPDDLDEVAAIHAEAIAGQRLRVDRDRSVWDRLLAGRERPRITEDGDAPFWVIERGGRVDAYVVLGGGRPTARWREHGARRGAENPLADLFWSVLAWARGARLARIEGWCMPDTLTVQPLYPTSDRSRKGNVPMLRSLDPQTALPDFRREDECRLGEIDAL